MSALVDPSVCPDCRTPLGGIARCPACGLDLHGPDGDRLWAAMQAADAIIGEIRRRTDPAAVPHPPADRTRAATPGAEVGSATLDGRPDERPRRWYLTPVPLIMLALGGLFVLAAASLFVFAAWVLFSPVVRTMILFLITVVAVAVAAELTRRRLRAGAETLWSIVAGLVIFDLLLARDAHVLGIHLLSDRGLMFLIGVVLLLLGVSISAGAWLASRPRVHAAVAATGLGGVLVVIATATRPGEPWPAAIAVIAFGVIAVAVNRIDPGQTWAMVGTAVLAWLVVTGVGVDRAGEPAGIGSFWQAQAHRWPLLAAAGFAAGGALFRRWPGWARTTMMVATLLPLWVLSVATLSNPTTAFLIQAGFVVAVAALAAVSRRHWSLSAAGVAGLAAFVVAIRVGRVWADVIDGSAPAAWGDPAAWTLLPATLAVGAALGGAGLALHRHRSTAVLRDLALGLAPALVLVGIALWSATVAAPTPLTAALWGLTAAAAATSLRTRRNEPVGLATGAGFALLAAATTLVVAGPPDTVQRLLIAVLAAIVVIASITAYRLPRCRVALLSVGLVLGTAGLTLGDTRDRLDVSIGILGLSIVIGSAIRYRGDLLPWLAAPHLGASVMVAEIDSTPMPELMPLVAGVILLLAGIRRMLNDRSVSSPAALGAALVYSVGPAVLLALADPVSIRGAVVGIAGLVLLAIGTRLRWLGPFAAGAVTTALLLLRHLWPLLTAFPVWAYWPLFGVLGIILLAVGITWEARTREVAAARRYLAAMR